MLERKIIYYPTIVVPSQWAKWAVLYFDKVSSIIPQNLGFKEVVGSWNKNDFETMKILIDEGELEPSDPQSLVSQAHWSSVEAFEKEFKEIVVSKSFQSIINRKRKRNLIWRVHKDKVSYRTYEFLHELGLAEKDKENYNWFLMEEKTSLLYISLLAKYLADLDPDFTVPGTDREDYEKIIYKASSPKNGFLSVDTKFMNILPIPCSDVSIRNILRFKKRRRDELLHFREIIDNVYREISNAEKSKEIKQIIVSHQEKIEREVENLRNMMKEENIKTILGSFKSLLPMALASSIAQIPIKLLIPILGITAIIQISYYFVDRRNLQRAKLRKSPFAYLYYAQRGRIIQ